MSNTTVSTSLLNPQILRQALFDAVGKLTPKQQWKNPVMFVVYLGSMLTTVLWLQALKGNSEESANFILTITLWLWFTVLFANFAEAIAEGRSKAQAAFLRGAKRDMIAKKLAEPHYGASYFEVASSALRKGDVVLIL
jgi:K+-transporting ATPase ATPase B chain